MKEPFAMIPQRIFELKDLSVTARLILAWLLGRPKGWVLNISYMCHTLGISSEKWRKARKELEKHRYFRQTPFRTKTGKINWKHEWAPTPKFSNDGFAIQGKANQLKTVKCKTTNIEKIEKEKEKEKEKGGGRATSLSLKENKHFSNPRIGDFGKSINAITDFVNKNTGAKDA